MDDSQTNGLLIRVPLGAGLALQSRLANGLSATGVGFEIEPLFRTGVPAQISADAAATAETGFEWFQARPKSDLSGASPWDLVHAALSGTLKTEGTVPILIEPDLLQKWAYDNPISRNPELGAAEDVCVFNDQTSLPGVSGQFAWHLGDDYSQLRAARLRLQNGTPGQRIRIAHLDTGYDPQHQTFPARVRLDLQRNFIEDQGLDDAHDPGRRGLLKNPGHGTGTLGILAGGEFRFQSGHYAPFAECIGGAPEAEIIPVRVGSSVVQFQTSSVAAGISYVADLCGDEGSQVHVISMSMGGLASQAWADAVNKAYESGVVYVAAAGNNFSAGVFGVPTRFIVYPARFRRVIAACGVMANRQPYYGLPLWSMQGNWGPESKMRTALAAFTPNIPWAELGCAGLVDMDGQGTSAATPQIAAAAALYLQLNRTALFDPGQYPEPWMRVEAVRHVLFSSADRPQDKTILAKLGNGILKAERALQVPLPLSSELKKTGADSASVPLIKLLFGTGMAADPKRPMLELEAAQLLQRWERTDLPNPFEREGGDPDDPGLSVSARRELLSHLVEHPLASRQLRKVLAEELAQSSETVRGADLPEAAFAKVAQPSGTVVATPVRFFPPEPPFRALRGFSIDPGLATDLSTVPISQITFRVPWEKLEPGPTGEYLEVIDIDPGSNKFYEPINLDDPALLAQEGLAPSDGTPQFHQQMVYAVASLTIENFEHALGRRALWRSGPASLPDNGYVQRLRIHPHALREKNAYYTPSKVALLFGYFNASSSSPGEHMPGEMVFACLSHDIIAHETTHALLDGMTRSFIEPTNPDVLAFHEAFADIVALFQHFTFPELVYHQITHTRGQLRSQENLLAELAGQFGRGMGLRGSLRSAIGEVKNGQWVTHQPDPDDYAETKEPHARGAILVAAVFDAFLSIFEHRTADLLRLATGGTGLLGAGQLNPDLANRLAQEAAKSASHVLTMCVRALDYCPPVDITFGEYLRAIITADFDLVPNDDLHYRVAFIEAFRRRGIYPSGLRTLSEESLLWRSPETDETSGPSDRLQTDLAQFRNYADRSAYNQSRKEIFDLQCSLVKEVEGWLEAHFRTDPQRARDALYLGLDLQYPITVRSARFAYRTSPDGGMIPQLLLSLLQERKVPVDPACPAGEQMQFQGGCTVIADLRRARVKYCIRKSFTSSSRLNTQQQFTQGAVATGRANYFGAAFHGLEPFAALHRGT